MFTNGSHGYFDGKGRTGGRVIPELKPLTAAQAEGRRQELEGGFNRRQLSFQGQLKSKAMRENRYHLWA